MAAQAGTLQFMALPEIKTGVRYLKLTHGPQISVLDKRKPTLSIRSLFAHRFFLSFLGKMSICLHSSTLL